MQKRTVAALKEASSTIQTKMCDYVKKKEDMRSHQVSIEVSKLLTKPQPFQYDDQLDPNERQLFSHERAFYDYVEEEEEKRQKQKDLDKACGEKMAAAEPKKNPPRRYLSIVKLTSHGTDICQGCNNIMTKCHDVIYGPWCVKQVVSYVREHPEFADDLVVKKIFIDAYNRALSLDIFREEGKDVQKNGWIFPTRCMQDNSYDYAIYWYGDNYEHIYNKSEVEDNA